MNENVIIKNLKFKIFISWNNIKNEFPALILFLKQKHLFNVLTLSKIAIKKRRF